MWVKTRVSLPKREHSKIVLRGVGSGESGAGGHDNAFSGKKKVKKLLRGKAIWEKEKTLKREESGLH